MKDAVTDELGRNRKRLMRKCERDAYIYMNHSVGHQLQNNEM